MRRYFFVIQTLFYSTVFLWAASWLQAEPLKSATIMEVKNKVDLKKESDAERPAAKNDQMSGKDVLSTGVKSRVELEFTDRSIARLGSNTIFSFDPQSREMTVQKGSALIHVPPGQKGATQIHSPAATAAILGDVIAMGVTASGATRIIALSQDEKGPVQVTLHKTGETRTLRSGDMVMIEPMALKIPEPIQVSVDAIAQSSGLIGGFEKPLPKTALIEVKTAQDVQAQQIASGMFEGGNRLKAGTVDQTMPREARTVAVQSASTSGFAGHYEGKSLEQVGSNPGSTSFLNMDISPDGRMRVFSPEGVQLGFVNANGFFRVEEGDGRAVTGQMNFGSGTISGTYSVPNKNPPPATESGIFNLSK